MMCKDDDPGWVTNFGGEAIVVLASVPFGDVSVSVGGFLRILAAKLEALFQ